MKKRAIPGCHRCLIDMDTLMNRYALNDSERKRMFRLSLAILASVAACRRKHG